MMSPESNVFQISSFLFKVSASSCELHITNTNGCTLSDHSLLTESDQLDGLRLPANAS